jgi:hypothetical protein
LDGIASLVERLGMVQIDTLQMVARSQYIVLWSRLGSRYQPQDFDQLIYNAETRRLFEGWAHAACILPISEYRFQMVAQRHMREHGSTWFDRWIHQPGNQELHQAVLERIRAEGGRRANHFDDPRPERGTWWDWKPAKIALEVLYTAGDLMISERVKFQRVYDLTERVLPDWVDRTEPTRAERDRHWIELGARALGCGTPPQLGSYTHRKVTEARPVVAKLVKEGVLVSVLGEQMDGQVAEWLVHKDNLPLLQAAADGALPARRTTFLSFFDSLFWAVGRSEQLWGFKNTIEAYVPKAKRKYGYFCLSILHHDRIVGRFDPKLERKTGTLRLFALYLEPQVELDDELVAGVAAAMRDFMTFHGARNLVIERSQPPAFAARLEAAL